MLPGKVRTATSITPEIRDLLQGRKVQWVSVARGPGSFTGLRIGVTTAKTLAFGWQAQLIAVDSLAAVASAAFENDPKSTAVWVAVNAYRGQVFAGSFRNSSLRAEMDPMTLESELRSIGNQKSFRRMNGRPSSFALLRTTHRSDWRATDSASNPLKGTLNDSSSALAMQSASRCWLITRRGAMSFVTRSVWCPAISSRVLQKRRNPSLLASQSRASCLCKKARQARATLSCCIRGRVVTCFLTRWQRWYNGGPARRSFS